MQVEKFSVEGAKGGGGKPHTPVESPDSLNSLAKVRMLLALSEGTVKGNVSGKSIFLDGTPLQNADDSYNYPNVTWDFRDGTATQDPIKGFPAVEKPTSLGTDLKQATPWVKEFTDLSLDAVRVRLGFPMMQYSEDDGDTVGTRVDYRIELSTDGGAYVLLKNMAAVGKCTSLYERDHRIDLPKSATGWRIRITRLTADSSNQRLQNRTTIQGYTEIIDSRLRYPFTSLLFVEFDAKSFPNIPKVSVLLYGREVQVPSNYDPETRAYTGDWDGSFKWAWTDNPAWIYYDLATAERFSLGYLIKSNMLDKWALYTIGKRCDQLVPDGNGGTEPRFTCNVYIQNQAAAWDVLRDFANIFNGSSFWANGQLVVNSDMPGDVKQIITRSDVVGGKFNYAGGSVKNRYSSAVISIGDKTNHYNDKALAVANLTLQKRYGFNQVQANAIGCTSEGQGQRKGQYMLLTNMLDRTVSFKMGAAGINFLPGYIVALADERLSGAVMGGRVVAYNAATRTLELDRATGAAIGDRVLVRTSEPTAEARTIAAVNGTTLHLQTAFKSDPVPDAVFVIDAAQLKLQTFRVLSMKWVDGEDCFDITAIIHNESKFDAIDNGARLDVPPISLLPTGAVPPPTGIVVSATEMVTQGRRVTVLHAEWLAPVDQAGKIEANIIGYEMQWRRGNNDWINMPQTGSRFFDVPDVYAGQYLVRVRAINSGNGSSIWASSSLTDIAGRAGDVPVPVNFRTSPMLWGVQLDWAFGLDTADTSHTEIQYSVSNNAAAMLPLTNATYPAATYQQTGLKAGQTFYYRARLVDRNGNQSDWTAIIAGTSNADQNDYLDSISDGLLTSEDGQRLTESIDGSLEAAWQAALQGGSITLSQYQQTGLVRAEILQVATTVANVDKAMAELSTELKAQLAENTAALSEKLTAMVDADGASAIYTLKVGVKYNGQEILAGMSVAAIAQPGGGAPVARVAFNADEFVLLSGSGNQLFSPFAVKGGQVFIDDAFIGEATIDFGKITDTLRSTDFVSGDNGKGWNLPKSGDAELNNVTIRGKVYATDGDFKGTVYANRIEGDIYTLQSGPRVITSQTVACNWNSWQYYNIYTYAGELFDRVIDSDMRLEGRNSPEYISIVLDLVSSDGTWLSRVGSAYTNGGQIPHIPLSGFVIPATKSRTDVVYLRMGVQTPRSTQTSYTFGTSGTRVAASRAGRVVVS